MVELELRSGFYRPAEEVISKRRLGERSSVGEEGEIGHGSVSPRAAGEMAARVAWRACGRAAEQFGWRWGASKRRVEASATQEGARGRPRAAGGATTRRRQQKQRGRLEVEDRDLNAISKISGT